MDLLVRSTCLITHMLKVTDGYHASLNRFAFAILAANQLVAVSNIVKFHYDDGIVLLNWKTGEEVDHAVWFSAFLICVIIFNMFPVRVGYAREKSCQVYPDVQIGVWRARVRVRVHQDNFYHDAHPPSFRSGYHET
jgi:hypothetical protein